MRKGMRGMAESYALELEARFRTLNHFVNHAGEIGRAHEHLLRSVLERLLPAQYEVGTGFYARPWAAGEGGMFTSTQQDILIYDPTLRPLLFKIDSLVVADWDAVVGAVEVKTRLERRHFEEMWTSVAQHGGKFSAIFAWEGPTLDTLLGYFRECLKRRGRCADAIYVRGKYLVFPRHVGRALAAPLGVYRLDDEFNNGDALLALLDRLWISGLQMKSAWPWWLDRWRDRWRDRAELIELEPMDAVLSCFRVSSKTWSVSELVVEAQESAKTDSRAALSKEAIRRAVRALRRQGRLATVERRGSEAVYEWVPDEGE